MCCILEFLKYVLSSFSIVIAVLAFFVVTLIFLKIVYRIIFPKQRKVTVGYKEQWFGKESPDEVVNDNLDTSVRPFKISVSDDVLEDLKRRLQNTRFEDPVEDSKFLYGFNPNYLRKVLDYWRKEYNWREHEEMLNKFPQFKTRIEGIDVHFLHVKPDLPQDMNLQVIPLLVIHGWPGSVLEFYKLIPLLTTPRPGHDFVFEVICPSIPGYGFSESPHRKGLTARAAARMFLTLMERIGHRRFYVQGGDWGSLIVQLMARYYSPRILGLHMNMYIGSLRLWEAIKFLLISIFPFLVSKAEYNAIFPLKKFLKMIYVEGGYFHLQSTKPDTLGCGMADSPAGMAAYLMEKFAYATNPEHVKLEDGGLTEKFTMDELLTNVMMYWINNNFTAAVRFYKENLSDVTNRAHEKVTVKVPTGIAVFPNEVLMLPKTCMSQQVPNIVSYNIMPRGGHFAALEEPQLLADDVWQFVKKVEK